MPSTLTKDQILEAISSMSVLELSELVKAFEERFGVTAAAPVAVAGPAGPAAAPEAPAEEEQDEFDVVLTGAGDKKIQVIKEVRSLTSLG
ncbi:MAG: 50S ribosomal protein L7/L12, partial [Acidimicrobiales bacterium]